METVWEKKLSYPMFLWITGCKILFIAGDNVGKTPTRFEPPLTRPNKILRFIMLLFPRFYVRLAANKLPVTGGYFLTNQ
ncbi:hypothetical protein COO59_13745 [Mixta theicola]|uniref:Uncharacterized protein n=1 Tax=Mixta theicola TaxID=1458355 RepID=A0A2K1Q7I4_9GAMM|nr:hypothetical protein [Mixta theicola]PNS10992.1 hypothetical protein COO59_13745 [Mixta theicola]